jgi:tripartite-type tricarboxylate transporter receptor subunit TctC
MQPKLPYVTDKESAPMILIGRSFNVLVVKPDSRLKSVKDVLDIAKAEPGP